jgi:glycosyltransferase involved in cell wall biosynthesis
MTAENPTINPLVSVIIPCFNHAKFLAEAIASVHQQTHKNTEIIVVDDGSSDNTRAVSQSFPDVKYVYQNNQGLSAARNTGILNSNGEYLVFLDADDLLYPLTIEINLRHLQQDQSYAFASGWHDKVDEWKYPLLQDEQEVVSNNHYLHLLRGNYIGMHAAVIYRRWVFNEFKFDTTIKACEDYNLYFDIARKYPVINHSEKMAAYRLHGVNMSANIPFMLKHVLLVLERQKNKLQSEEEKKAYLEGQKIWKYYYTEKLYRELSSRIKLNNDWPTLGELNLLAIEKPKWLLKYLLRKAQNDMKTFLKKNLPDEVLKWLHRKGLYRLYTPAMGKVKPGDFERKTPFSFDFGFDRGGPVDRYYIENFLERNKRTVKGRVLEIGDNEYSFHYGENRITQSDILHIDSANQKATFVGDLSNAPQVPSVAFDCIILTQTLHFIYDFKAALQTCYRVLKPGGVLLLTVPGISHIDHGEWREYWLWAFTDKSMTRIMEETFPSSKIEIETFGNVFVASAFLYGMGLPEMKKEFLDYQDPSYQVIITVKATKPL